MPKRVDQCVAHVKFDDDDDEEDSSLMGMGFDSCGSIDVEVKLKEEESKCFKKPRRGRPPRTMGKRASSPKRRREEEEDVCFVCFDGGNLVLCDRRGCPKAYHPACVKRTEAFFRSRSKWNCGWHICSACQKDSFYMCYTCPYSVCKQCVRTSEYVLVRNNKGFCGICVNTILLIENPAEPSEEKVQVDFDDQGSWEYLFKIYWVSLKEKLSLSLDDLIKARNPWKSSASKRRTTTTTTTLLQEKDDSSSPGVMKAASLVKVRKMEAMSFQVDERLNTSEQHQEGDSQQLNEHHSVQVRPSSSHDVVKSAALSNKPIDDLKQEERVTIANDQNRSVAVTKLESGVLDFSSNSACTDQSVITSSNSVITKSSDACNRSGNAWDSNSSGLVSSFTDNQEIDFLDLFSPIFKFNFASNDTTTDCWQPIVTGPDECDESVSDLLAEVEAMESLKRLPSPTSTFREGHSPSLDDVSKGDSMSSTNAFKN